MASIRERTSKTGETTWAVLYRHGDRQSSLTFTAQKPAEAFKVLVDAHGPDKALKLLDAAAPTGLTVSELAKAFLDHKARDVTPRTMIDYRRDVKNWVLPWFGHRAAEHLDERDVQQWVDHMAGHLAPKSVADRHMLLHSMFQFGRAKSRRLVSHNPCSETELPKNGKKPAKGTTLPEFAAILEAARGPKKKNGDAADVITFLGETGWRFSEAVALDVAYVDDDGESVWVTVGQVFRVDGNHRYTLAPDEAKSYAAFRRIRLLPASAAVVRRRVVGKGPGDLVFLNSRGRPWSQNTFLRSTWPGILTAAGLWKGAHKSPTPHWLRHMHVAVLVKAGVGLPEIQRRIGHESIQTTIDVYGSMVEGMNDDQLGRASVIMAGGQSVVAGTVLAETPLEVAALGGVQVIQPHPEDVLVNP